MLRPTARSWTGVRRCRSGLSGAHHQDPAVGFTTIELMIGLVVIAILAALALPSYQQHLRRVRRSEALTAVALIQQAQERRRAEQPVYAASLGTGGLEMASTSASGLYALATATALGSEATSYSVRATAQGPQEADLPCTHLRVEVNAGSIVHRSGASSLLDNDAAANRRCWNL